MGYKQDWLLNQIEDLVRFVAKIIFNKDTITYEIENDSNLTECDLLYKKIKSLLQEDKICESEDLIFKNLDKDNNDYLKLAIDFYSTINKYDDKKLEVYNFSREEIIDGLKDVLNIYNIPTIVI
ncbi:MULTISPECIES: DUF6483 family protein [unclassified Romboutsia]|uniref:DUF6483 family protein n=1 Tax=unclassified Romboutsia TaxID=2626894 RepID=UPI000821FFC3|nr:MULTISPECIES: DUF6483 family protein [unclassified Romboutsia]SCH74772.1 Uncharacterised protein [uncultured Clostridium sp.]